MELLYLIFGILLIILFIGMFLPTVVVKTDFSSNAMKHATVYYYLPETILKIKATIKVAVIYNAESKLMDATQILETNYVLQSEMIGDTSELLALNYKPNVFMSDVIKYAVNAKGLLETVNIITEDRTTEIFSKLSIIFNDEIKKKSIIKTNEVTTVKIKDYAADFEIKVSEISNSTTPKIWNLLIYNELGVDELPKMINAGFNISSTDILSTSPSLSSIINKGSNHATEINGILTRPVKNIVVKIEPIEHQNISNFSFTKNVMVADVNKLIVIPVKRTAFVKRINTIGIQDGIILNHEITKSSSIESLLAIPINIAKAIVSIPAQIFQFKFDNTKRHDGLDKIKNDGENNDKKAQKILNKGMKS